jgi:hypothetical protein
MIDFLWLPGARGVKPWGGSVGASAACSLVVAVVVAVVFAPVILAAEDAARRPNILAGSQDAGPRRAGGGGSSVHARVFDSAGLLDEPLGVHDGHVSSFDAETQSRGDAERKVVVPRQGDVGSVAEKFGAKKYGD